jgi:hypothetical protein
MDNSNNCDIYINTQSLKIHKNFLYMNIRRFDVRCFNRSTTNGPYEVNDFYQVT